MNADIQVKNVQSRSVSTKVCFVQGKPARKPISEQKPFEKKHTCTCSDSKSPKHDVDMYTCNCIDGNSHALLNQTKLGRHRRI